MIENPSYDRVLADEKDQAQIWSPTLQIDRAKTIQRTRKFGPTERDYFWYDSFNR